MKNCEPDLSDTPQQPAQPDHRIALEAYLFLAFTAMCWGGNAVLGRFAVGEVSPMMVVISRWVGVMILCAVFLLPGLKRDWPVLKKHLPFLALMGALGFTCFNGLFYVAAHTTTALNMGIMQGSIPIFVLIGAFFSYRMRLNAIQTIGVLLTVGGVVTVASGGSLDRLLSLAFNTGDVLMLIACALYAGYTVALRKRPPVSTLSMFAVMATAAFFVAIPFVAVEAALGQFQWPTMTGWIVIALVTVFPSFLAQVLFIQGVDRIGPGRAGVFMNLVPIFASVMAVLFLREAFEFYHAAALCLVLIGIYLSEKYKPR